MKRLFPILFMILALPACHKEPDYSHPTSLELLRIVDCKDRPHAILACQCNGDFFVLNTSHSRYHPSMKVDRYNCNGDFLSTLVDFMNFDRGNFLMYIPRDLAMDEEGNLYVVSSPVTDTSEGYWETATGFSILEFNREGGFERELDFSSRDEGLARMLSFCDGSLYTCYSPEIFRIDLHSGVTEEIPFPADPAEESFFAHEYSDMEITTGGRVYFCGPYYPAADSGNCRILKSTTEFRSFTQCISTDATQVFAAMVGTPGLSVHRNGDIYLANFYGSGIEVYDPEMSYIFTCPLEGTGEDPTLPIDVATWKDRVYVADYSNSQVIILSQQ
jgi:hypothetical protein